MGQELVPGHMLFAGTAQAQPVPVASPVSGDEDDGEPLLSDGESLTDLDLNLDAELSGLSDQPLEGASEFVGLEGGPSTEPAEPIGGGEQGISVPEIGEAPETDSEFTLDLGGLDSLDDIDLGELKEGGSHTLFGGGGEPPPLEEQEVEPLELEREASVPESAALAEPEEEEIPPISLDELELGDLEPEKPDEENQPLSDLPKPGDWGEEVETKLDLARAYLEMGDGDGAREILDEVVKEGDKAQQKLARELMEQLD